MDQQAKFEGWAIVELFGHQREAGFVTTQYFGNAAMFQLDVPELPEREWVTDRPEWIDGRLCPKGATVKKPAIAGRSRLINPSAVYALNPSTEQAAKAAVDGLSRREIALVQLPEGVNALPPADEEEFADDDEEEVEVL